MCFTLPERPDTPRHCQTPLRPCHRCNHERTKKPDTVEPESIEFLLAGLPSLDADLVAALAARDADLAALLNSLPEPDWTALAADLDTEQTCSMFTRARSRNLITIANNCRHARAYRAFRAVEPGVTELWFARARRKPRLRGCPADVCPAVPGPSA